MTEVERLEFAEEAERLEFAEEDERLELAEGDCDAREDLEQDRAEDALEDVERLGLSSALLPAPPLLERALAQDPEEDAAEDLEMAWVDLPTLALPEHDDCLDRALPVRDGDPCEEVSAACEGSVVAHLSH